MDTNQKDQGNGLKYSIAQNVEISIVQIVEETNAQSAILNHDTMLVKFMENKENQDG